MNVNGLLFRLEAASEAHAEALLILVEFANKMVELTDYLNKSVEAQHAASRDIAGIVEFLRAELPDNSRVKFDPST